MKKDYNSKDIVVLEGLDAVRMRPGMYIGTTGLKGLHHILWEIVDNSMDEISNGYGNKITVTLHNDGSVSVEDDGRGVPVDIHPKLKISGVEVVFTQLHAGGKFESDNYTFSGGLHGVGASVTNALSEWCNVEVNRDGKKYEIKFASITNEKGHIVSGHCISPLKCVGNSEKRGTKVTFLPDKRVFENTVFSLETVAGRLRELAYLNKGVDINLVDERVEEGKKPLQKQYKYEGGIADFVQYLNTSKTVLYQKPIYFYKKTDLMEVEVAIQHTSEFSENIFSYVNNIPTSEGGTHETGFRSALTRCFNDMGKKLGFIKEKEENLLGNDYKEGLSAVLTVKMRNVQFEGQTKTKLGNPEAKTEVESIVFEELSKEIFKNENKKSFEQIIQKAKTAQKTRLAVKKAKDLTRQKNNAETQNLVGKLANCSGRKPELNELFIVEGDSAGGSAKQGRDRNFQAILPLKGKPLNVEKKRLDQTLQNEEIRTLITAIGTGISDNFDIKGLKYHKIIILADADQDGGHIKSILLTFFYRFLKELINGGYIYVGMPPLYKVEKNNKTIYCYTDTELEEAKTKFNRGYTIQRYKGLGEMNPEQLWETTMDPKRRRLTRVTIDDVAEVERMITTWMGDDADLRKEYITRYADFNKEDKFIKLNDTEKK